MLKAIVIVGDIICAALYLIWGVKWAGSVVIFTFAIALAVTWFVTLANGTDRINGVASDQIAVQRIADLMAKTFHGRRDP